MSEYIGSRISLISKSDIKYVGTLKSIDSETATVSLQDVQCHGTEGRKGDPSLEISGSDAVYEGIVFRGSDVKDLTILAPPKENRPPQPQMPNDPAILGSSEAHQQQQQPPQPPPQSQQQQQQQQPRPPPQQQQNQFRGPPPPYQGHQPQFGYNGPPPPGQFPQPSRFNAPGGAHGFPGQPGAVPGYGMNFGGPPPPGYGPPGQFYGPPGQGFEPPGHFPSQQPMPIGPPGMNQQRPPQQMPDQQRQAPIGSKQSTPQPAASQAPQAPSVQPPQSRPAEMSTTPATPNISGLPPPVESKPKAAAAIAPSESTKSKSLAQAPAPTAAKATSKTNNRVAIPLAPSSPAVAKQQTRAAPAPQAAAPTAQPSQTHSPATATEAATAAVAAAMAKLGAVNQHAGAVENLSQKVNQMRVQDGQTRGRGRGRGGAPRGGRRESQPKTVDVPKEDFDFESANAKFNKQDLVKEAIASGSPIASPSNGDTADPLTSATNGHKDDEVVIPPKEKGYDKKSSFFDNISSDLKDRASQQQTGSYIDGRAMRREERSKNMDTFGQGSIDGGFRGRGRGRGRGFGGRGRGGFESPRGGYENRGGFRGRGRGGYEAAAV